MEIRGQYLFNFRQAAVWQVLMTPEAIALAIPGRREMQAVEGEVDTYRIASRLNNAGLRGLLEGVIRLVETEAPHRYRLLLEGEAMQRKLTGSARFELEPITSAGSPDDGSPAPSQTRVRWILELHAHDEFTTGEFTRGLIQVSAAVLSKQFFRAIEKIMADSAADSVNPQSKLQSYTARNQRLTDE